ncbi:MAG: transglutaminase domain-containing protein, partial [Bacillota bacterium]
RAAVSSLGAHVLLGGLLCCLCAAIYAGVAGELWLRAGKWLTVHLPAAVAVLGLPMSLRVRGGAGRGIRVFCLAVVAAAAAWAVRLGNVPQAALLGAYVVFGWLVGKGRFDRGSLARWAAASVVVPLLVVAWRDPRAALDLPRAAQQVPAAASLNTELLQLRGAAAGCGSAAGADAVVEALDLDRDFSPIGFGFPGDTRVLFEVRARDIGSGYFRVTGLERYVGDGWKRVPEVPPWGKWPAGTSKRLSYEVVFREALPGLPALWRPAEVSGGHVDAHGDAVAGAGGVAVPGSRYHVVSEVPDVGSLVPHLKAAGTSYPAAVRQVCLEIPASVPGRVRELARQVVSGCRTPYEKAAALERFLRTRYPYAEQGPESPPGRDFVDFFLFGCQKGKCNHFATAMAVMCRSVGVPARVAEGYLPAARVAQDRYVFTTATSHMWVEVYFPGVGWVPFDPTGERTGGERLVAVPLQRHPGGSGGPDGLPPRPEPDGSAPPSPEAAGGEREREAPAQEKPEEPQREVSGQETAGGASRQSERRMAGVSGMVQRMRTAVPWQVVARFGIALAAVGAAGLAWFAWRHRKLVRRAGLLWVVRRRVAGRRLDLAEVFLHVCRGLFADLARVGLGRGAGETVLEAAWRVSALTGDEGLVRAAWAFSAVRYGGERPGEEALKFVCALRRRVRSRSWRKAVALRLREAEWDGEPEN